MTASVPDVPIPAQSRKSSFQRMAGVLFAPAETFEDIARKPDIVVPLVTIVIVAILGAIVTVPKFDFETAFREQMAQSGRQMSSEDMDRAMTVGLAFAKVVAYASPFFTIVIIAIIAAVLLFAFRIMGGEGTFKQAFSTTLYSWIPLLVYSIIAAIVVMSRDSVSPDQMATMVRSNPAFLVDFQSQRVLFSLLSSLDLFTIWTLVLLSIGFSAVSRFSKAKSAVIVVGLWIVVLVFKAGFAALAARKAGPA